ncbi:hypothetical protein QA943_20375 [Streptomyces sp. B21-097]
MPVPPAVPLIGCVIDLPQEAAALVGFLIAFRLRAHVTRRPTRA